MRTALAALGVVALWAAGVASAVLPLWFGGTYPGLVAAFIFWTAVIAGCAGLGVLSRRRWLAVVAAVAAAGLYLVCFNWVVVAPEAWFRLHRPAYDAALDHVDRDDHSLYGGRLPLRYAWLTADGRAAVKSEHVSSAEGPDTTTGPDAVFFAQWYGVPDDGGGYFWSPDRSPEGLDMAGSLCRDPEDLGDGWWMCGMG